jgi:hypothetical protein
LGGRRLRFSDALLRFCLNLIRNGNTLLPVGLICTLECGFFLFRSMLPPISIL